ncbi:hypothetical protein CKO25_12435 [Thiocapsa imhoffii]|uniref:Uncharacterized protein n=1 Tax=Thiocapsa imhoffii TaxID=382777 RepID=A0A9X1B933_9GAMM|nr:hypothetical protein [Thiocapsa imhoffii]MBK1645437.1 hypothetical protein [Thiocapsa imhoffii]
MISTGTLMLGKALLTAGAIMGFLLWQLHVLRRMKREDAARKAAQTAEAAPDAPIHPSTRTTDHANRP